MMWTRIACGLALALAAGTAEAQQGRSYDRIAAQQAQVLAEVGGAYDGPQQAYVRRIGERMATAAGLGGQCVFTIIDNDAINAFTTPPGCYVYVTRGLLAILNSEGELAAVLGHELGHVAANHAQKQQSQEAITGLAAVLVGAATKSDLAGAVAKRAAKLGSLGYSRAQEYEADSLSLRYLPQAGYAPRALPDVLADLQREDEFSARLAGRGGEASTPGWARTHPLTTDRIRRAVQQSELAAPGDTAGLNSETYLSAVDGLVYGDDADQGYVSGRTFSHPGLGIAFEAPPGFQLVNQSGAVRIDGPDGLRGEFAAGRASPSRLEDYADAVLRGILGDAAAERGRVTRTTINGLDAVILPARASSRNGLMEVVVAAYAAGGDRAYHFATIAPAGRGGVFDPMYDSFRRLSGREAAAGGPRRIQVVTVRPGDTSESLSDRMAGEAPLGTFLMLNGLQRGEPLTPGRRVKLVTGGRRPR